MTHPDFTLLRTADISELNTIAKIYRHDQTGAEILSLENEDENKAFGITFRTPPPDSTGLPHILEHCVLCGSRKYPLKKPFVELLKGSLNTFLNAMTFSDKTCYPVASTNLKDYYNLVDVYLDAVLHPRLTPEILQQEGWHYELKDDDPAQPLLYKGVVFNEMKGAYSSPENLLGRLSEQVLFPQNTYHHDSGGDPAVMPDLTFEQFEQFHQTYYHPSNARIFMYGDDDPARRLELLAEYLNEFEAKPVASHIDLHPQFEQPRHETHTYAVSDDTEDPKAMVNLNWLLPENNNPELTFALQMLAYTLLGTPASPLYKALIDSGLGEDVIGGGLGSQLRQLTFTAGLKGIKEEDAAQVETLILETLKDLSETGIDPATTEAAINTVEFRLREQNFGSFPRGLVLMIWSLTTWLHEGDPLAPLAFEGPLQRLKSDLAEDDRYFEKLIRTHLLENPHRVTLLLKPDPQLQAEQEEAERQKLADVKASLSEDELTAIIENTRYLRQLQITPDPPEAVATIPSLTLDDLDPDIIPTPTTITQHNQADILHHDLFTNGIVYLNLAFDMHVIPTDLLPYVSLFSDALTDIGTESEDFVKLSQRIGRKTGGIGTSIFVSNLQNSTETTAWFLVRGKSTLAQAQDMLDLMRDMLLTVKLDNPERFMQMLLEDKAGEEASLIPAGHAVANGRLRAKLDEASWVNEQMGGLDYLFFLRNLVNEVKNDWPSVLAKLEAVRRLLVNRAALKCSVTLDAESWATFQPQLTAFVDSLPAITAPRIDWKPQANLTPEGWTIPAKVNYVAQGANLYQLGYKLHGSISVITHYLRTTWLWNSIREQGGAYGGFCSFDNRNGVFSFISYRDPNLLDTLKNYAHSSEFLRELQLDQADLTRSIIGTFSNMDRYQLPDARGYSAFVRHLIGYTDDMRRQYRLEVLHTTAANFKAFAEVLELVNQHGVVTVLGSAEAIKAANEELEPPLVIQKAL